MPSGVGGVRIGGLERRMRDRWRTVSSLWEENKSSVNKLNVLGQFDYHRATCRHNSSGNENPRNRPVRVVYNEIRRAPTAALLQR